MPDSLQPIISMATIQLPAVLLINGAEPDLEAELARGLEAGLSFATTCSTCLLEPFAGLTELTEQLYAAANALGRPELALRQWIPIRLIAPGLAGQVPPRRPEAFQGYRPGDTGRRAPPGWAQRHHHGLIDLLFELQEATGRPLSVGFRNLHMANHQVKAFVATLVRRAARRPILVWATAGGELSGNLVPTLKSTGVAFFEVTGMPVEVVAPPAPQTATVEQLAAAMDHGCNHGLWDEVIEWGRLALVQARPEHHHILPKIIETFRVAQSDPKVAEQLLLQSLPYIASLKQRVTYITYLTIMFGQWNIDPVRGNYYAALAMETANSATDPAERAELRLIATHGLILVYSNSGRIPEAQQAGAAAIRDVEAHCAWEVERVRRSMVLYLMGQNCERLGQGEAAIEYYKRSLAYDQDYPEYYHYLCAALTRVGRFAETLEVLKDAMERTPPYWRLHMWRGQALAGLGQNGEARAEFDRAIELDPTQGQPWLSRALFRHEMGDLRGAVADYTAYLQLVPGDMEALANRGSALHDLGDLAAALADLDLALERRPDLVSALVNRAALLADLGRPADALADIDRALALEPDNVIIQENRTALLAVVK